LELPEVGVTTRSVTAASTAASYTANYTYDALNRPLDISWSPVVTQTTPTASNTGFAFSYDATNRRVGQTATDKTSWLYPTTAASTSYTPNVLNQYSAIGTVTPTYDGNGNLTYDGALTYCYDAESRQTGIISAGTCATQNVSLSPYLSNPGVSCVLAGSLARAESMFAVISLPISRLSSSGAVLGSLEGQRLRLPARARSERELSPWSC
jgi:hypothetical protein